MTMKSLSSHEPNGASQQHGSQCHRLPHRPRREPSHRQAWACHPPHPSPHPERSLPHLPHHPPPPLQLVRPVLCLLRRLPHLPLGHSTPHHLQLHPPSPCPVRPAPPPLHHLLHLRPAHPVPHHPPFRHLASSQPLSLPGRHWLICLSPRPQPCHPVRLQSPHLACP